MRCRRLIWTVRRLLVPFTLRVSGNDSFFRQNGHFVNLTTTGVYAHQQLESGAVAEERKLLAVSYPWSQMLFVGDWAYFTGSVWWRIRTETLQIERLLPDKTVLPSPYGGLRFGVSAHYGLIGYRRYVPPQEVGSPTMFQVTIADPAESPGPMKGREHAANAVDCRPPPSDGAGAWGGMTGEARPQLQLTVLDPAIQAIYPRAQSARHGSFR
jgi:hypothetical protein